MWLMALLTFRESWRKGTVLLAGALTLAFLILYGTGLHFATGTGLSATDPQADVWALIEAISLLVIGVYLASLLVNGVAVLAAVGSIAGEIENGTLHPLAVRPLSRRDLLLGKCLGLAAKLAIYAALFFLALTGLVRWQTGLIIPGLGVALGLFVLQPLVILSVTMLGTTRLTSQANGVFAFGLYVLAVVGGMMEQIGALLDRPATVYMGVVTSLILPTDAIYRRLVATLVDGIMAGHGEQAALFNPQLSLSFFGSQSTPSNWMLLYTLVYLVTMLAVAVHTFQRRDI